MFSSVNERTHCLCSLLVHYLQGDWNKLKLKVKIGYYNFYCFGKVEMEKKLIHRHFPLSIKAQG